jgi:hypothetical protein
MFFANSTWWVPKVVGLCAFPLDGDPHKAMGLIAHPGEVSALAVTYDGR